MATIQNSNGNSEITLGQGTGTMTINGAVVATGNVTANYIIGDGSQLTNLPGGGGGVIPPYRGFFVGVNRISGNDPSINQLIFANTTATEASVPAYSNATTNTDNDDFRAENLSTADTVAAITIFGNSDTTPIDLELLTTVAEQFIDLVLYDGETRVTDAATARTRFYANYTTIVAAVSDQLYENFTFFEPNYFTPTSSVVGGTGTGFIPNFLNASTTYVFDGVNSLGTGYTPGDVIVFPGTLIRGFTENGTEVFGTSPANDATVTITQVASLGQVQEFTVTGQPVTQWPANYINDGYDDQYDDGNFIQTNNYPFTVNYDNNSGILYAAGLPVSGSASDQYWNTSGGSSYVAVYQDSVFAMIAFGVAAERVNFFGNTGSDGWGSKAAGNLIGGVEPPEPSDRLVAGSYQLVLGADGHVSLPYGSFINTENNAVAIGSSVTNGTRNFNSIAIGSNAGTESQGSSSVAIGIFAGFSNQLSAAIAIGGSAGQYSQQANAVAIGSWAGISSQGTESIAIGRLAGQAVQGNTAVAIGSSAGQTGQAAGAIAIGHLAGNTSQFNNAVAIGKESAVTNQNANAVAVGTFAGAINQGAFAVAIGTGAGQLTQGTESIAIGRSAALNTQGAYSVAIGPYAGQIGQKSYSVAVGISSGANDQGANAVAIGQQAGAGQQGNTSVAIGFQTASSNQRANAIAVGSYAGQNTQGNAAIAVGTSSGYINQSSNAIAIGLNAAYTTQGIDAIAIGRSAGSGTQSTGAVAIGTSAGSSFQTANAVAIGTSAGESTQGNSAIAIGVNAGRSTQQTFAVAIGASAGNNVQGANAIAIGQLAGNSSQGPWAVAIGSAAGSNSQGQGAIAIGYNAASDLQGRYSIAIGWASGTGSAQANNSIVLNATGFSVGTATANTFVVKPVRGDSTSNLTAAGFKAVYYNPTTGEFAYSTS
jgi:hypothetical protein